MKILPLSSSLCTAALLVFATACFAGTFTVTMAAAAPAAKPAAPVAPESSRELTIVVVEPLNLSGSGVGFDDFDRIDLAFREVAKQRQWPLKLKVERFAANLPAYEIELRIFYQGSYDEIPGELSFRAWVTLTDKNGKNDFGIVRYRYHRRAGEHNDVMLEHIFRGLAEAIAEKSEPILFPKSAAPKS